MLEIAIVASGTRGDVQPYIALGRGLQGAGYAVRLLTSDNFAPLVRDAGLTFYSTGQSVEDLLQSAEWREVLDGGNFLKILSRMRAQMGQVAVETAQRLPPILRGSDLIIAGMSGLAGVFSVAEGLGIPVIQTHVFPFTPTREFPSPLVPKLPFGRALNRLSFQAMRQLFWQTFKAGDSAARQQLGLKRASFWRPFRSLTRSRVPVLYGYSPHVLPRPSDWADYQEVTGYWFLDAANDWTPPADLVKFLAAGPPPVYIGFGSMGSRNPEAAGRLAVEALARSGQRGVLAAGWSGLQVAELPATVHLISSVPHSWRFPRMAAVVHHGGAGTTAGLRAGIPSVLAPFMGDQAFGATCRHARRWPRTNPPETTHRRAPGHGHQRSNLKHDNATAGKRSGANPPRRGWHREHRPFLSTPRDRPRTAGGHFGIRLSESEMYIAADRPREGRTISLVLVPPHTIRSSSSQAWSRVCQATRRTK